ncbi:MAG: DMT family transporter, partial [candidate division Zixibacteria bacterium]
VLSFRQSGLYHRCVDSGRWRTSSVTAVSKRPALVLVVAAIAIQQLIASLCYPIAKVALLAIEPLTFAFYRFVISSAALLLLVWIRKPGIPIERKDWPRIILMGFMIIPFNQTLFLVGQAMTGAGHGAFLFATTPVWVAILATMYLGERPPVFRWIGIFLAVSGTMVIMSSGAVEIGSEYLWGDLILLVSVMAWAAYTVVGKPLVRKYGAIRMTAYSLAAGSAMYFPFGLYRAIIFDYSQATPFAWFAVVYMALGLSGVVYVLWYWLIKYMEASRVAIFQSIQPVIASAVAYYFLAESLGTAFVIGGLVVIAGVLLSEVRFKERV